jgi:hypothetical protein
MLPADERFGPDEAAVNQVNLGLVKQFELAAIGGKRQRLPRRVAFARLSARWPLLRRSSALCPPSG